MKELSIEEKARRYDEALEKARQLCAYPTTKPFISDLQDLFPELKESEDEKIRKALIDYFSASHAIDTFRGISWDRVVSWLEKQSTPQVRTGLEWVNTIDDACDKRYSEEYAHGEYCHEQSFKWGFQEGVDWLEKQGEQKPVEFDDTNAKQMFIKALERVEEQNNKCYKLTDCDKNSWWEDFKTYTSCIIEQKPADLPNGEDYGIDGLYAAVNILQKTLGKVDGYQTDDGILEHECAISAVKKLYEQNTAVWSEEDETVLENLIYALANDRIGNDRDEYVDCLKSLKDRVQQKEKWSEDDEVTLDFIVDYLLDTIKKMPAEEYAGGLGKAVVLLKKLKDRVQLQSRWKPSDEQMNTLEYYMHTLVCNEHKEILFGLYADLKKLKE